MGVLNNEYGSEFEFTLVFPRGAGPCGVRLGRRRHSEAWVDGAGDEFAREDAYCRAARSAPRWGPRLSGLDGEDE